MFHCDQYTLPYQCVKKNFFQKILKIMKVFALFCLELFDLSIEFVHPRKADFIL